jgi:RNA-binding protein
MELTTRQRRHLRALGHHLDPVIQVGHQGLTDKLVGEAERVLETHELIKVRVGEHAPGERHAVAEELAQRTRSALAQVLGRTFLLYRARAEDPAIVLPS